MSKNQSSVVSYDVSSITDAISFGNRALDDVDELNTSTPTLYGRCSEQSSIASLYESVISSKASKTVVIHGASGCGKTSLFEQLRQPVAANHGYFCVGKFDQDVAAQESYSAIAAALSDLCDLVSQSPDFDTARRDHARAALGEDAHILSRVISSLSQVIGETPDLPTDGDDRVDSAFSRFKAIFMMFLQVMTSPEYSVVLVLDDIQWMDEGSQRLIEMLLAEVAQLENLLLILVYRDEEADKVTTLLEKNQETFDDIALHNLDVSDVREMVSSMLNVPLDGAKPLADLMMQRTQGNPHFVSQFIDFIKYEKLLSLDPDSKEWKFDVDQIQMETILPDTLADALAKKIQRLPSHVQDTMIVASLLGFCFDGDVLTDVMFAINHNELNLHMHDIEGDNNTITTVTNILKAAVAEGFVEKTNQGYKFGHDKVQSSFRSMVSPSMIQQLHKVIGETYLSRVENTKSIFMAAVNLNLASELIQDPEQRIELAQINLDASRYCVKTSAFDISARLLRQGLSLIPDDDRKWTAHYQLAIESTAALGKMEGILGNFIECHRTFDTVLHKAKTAEEKIETLLDDLDMWLSEMALDSARTASNAALRIIGVPVPSKPSMWHVIIKLLKVRRLLRGKTDAQILASPIMTDRSQIAAVKILGIQAVIGLLGDDEDLTVYASLLAMELSLKMGLSPYAPNAFAMYSVAELMIGGFEKAYRFAKLSMEMLDHLQCRKMGSGAIALATLNVTHWRDSLHDIIPPLVQAAKDSFECGDLAYGITSAAGMAWARLFVGDDLEKLEQDSWALYPRLCDFKNDAMNRWYHVCFQYVLNLRDESKSWHELTVLSGEIMSEEEYMSFADQATMQLYPIFVHIFKLQLCFHFGDYDGAAAAVKVLKPMMTLYRFDILYTMWPFFGALTYYERYRRFGKGKHLRKARMFKKKLKCERKEFLECPQTKPLVPLLEAEDLSMNKKGSCGPDVLAQAYDKAIDVLKTAGFVHLEALANERAGFAFYRLKIRERADPYMTEALDLYKNRWKSIAKHRWLDKKVKREKSLQKPTSPAAAVVGNVISFGN